MTTIHQTVEICEDRRLRLDLPLPGDVPTGCAEIRITVTPRTEEPAAKPRNRLAGWFGCLKDSGVFAGDSVAIQRKMRDDW